MTKVGLMLYTLRDECARDFEGVLRAVAEIGYDGVELFDLHGHDAGRRARAGSTSSGSTPRAGMPALDALDTRAARARGGAANRSAADRIALSWIDPPASAERRAARSRGSADRAQRARASPGCASGSTTTGPSSSAFDDASRCSTSCSRCRPTRSGSSSISAGCGRPAPTPSQLLERYDGPLPARARQGLPRPRLRGDSPGRRRRRRLRRACCRPRSRGREWLIVEQDEIRRLPRSRPSSARSTRCSGAEGAGMNARVSASSAAASSRKLRRGLGRVRLASTSSPAPTSTRSSADAFAETHGLRVLSRRRADRRSVEIDVVLNLTPPAAHAAVVRAALDAGKHVYTEKPLTTTARRGPRVARREAGRRGLRHRLRARHVPRQRVRGGARADRSAATSATPLGATATLPRRRPRRLAPERRLLLPAQAAARCSTSRRTTSPRSRRCSARSSGARLRVDADARAHARRRPARGRGASRSTCRRTSLAALQLESGALATSP